MMIVDGGFGTMLQLAGLPAGKDPAEWNKERPEEVIAAHRAYVEAGAELVLSNSFGLNRMKYLGSYDCAELIRLAIANARASGARRVALDVGPLGRLLSPAGDVPFESALSAFAETIRAGAEAGADLVWIETMSDTLEIKAAVIAARENCDLPIYVTVALGEDGRLLTGATVECVATLLESLYVDAYGFNCGLGPDRLLPYVKRLAELSTRPIIVKPNAGMPHLVGERTVFDVGPEEFLRHALDLAEAGAEIIGGCCGTTPEHIRALAAALKTREYKPRPIPAPQTVISSGTQVLTIARGQGTIIGERINPTGRKRLREAYASGDLALILREAVLEAEQGAKALDVNCGVPGLNEAEVLDRTLQAVQSVVALPVQIDTSDPAALSVALRHVNGKALVNSVNGTRASMLAVFPLVRKYGGVIVALCLDESGIPDSVEGRLAIARNILAEGKKYGFEPHDFVFDALTLAVSSDSCAAAVTLETVRRLTDELGVNTILGVSNVSFGLPNRVALNAGMLELAIERGLSAAIVNPAAERPAANSLVRRVLLGEDERCLGWIAANAEMPPVSAKGVAAVPELKAAIAAGLVEDAGSAALVLLESGTPPIELIENYIVPALEQVGQRFESGKAFLPQLLMAADSAGRAFEKVRGALSKAGGSSRRGKRPIVIATVKGDIHDIGKNIVRALLENYGFEVIDLGRDVPPERIVEAARRSNAGLVGLSALMTTTVGAMAETIRQLKAAKLDCLTCVGGAVVTAEYAASIGADFYSKDAMRTVRIAEQILV